MRTAEPDNLQARYLEADCHLRMGAPKQVIELLAPIEPARQDDLALAYMLGLAYLQEKEMQKGRARRPDPQARRIGGGPVDAGDGQAGGGDLAGGLEALGKAVALNPELPSVHSLYGRALLETGNRDRAQAEFEAELARNPLDFDAHLYLGVLLKEDAQYDAAMAHFERAWASGPAIRACATRW